jgi:hypothetical protein
MAENYTDKKSGWSCSENQKEKKGMIISIYQRKVEGSNIDLIRTDSKLKGSTLDQFKTYMGNIENYMKNDKDLVDFKILEDDKANNRKVIYSEAKMPLMNNRTLVLDIKTDWTIDDGKSAFVIM